MTTRVLRGLSRVCLVLVLAAVTTGCPLVPANVPDDGLERALRKAADVPFGPLSQGALAQVTEVVAPNSGIRELKGLELCTNLVKLDLEGNEIRSISAIKDLTSLETVSLGGNSIEDISPLSGLFALNYVTLWGKANKIVDFQPLVANSELGGLSEGDTVVVASEHTWNTETDTWYSDVKDEMQSLVAEGVTVVVVTEAEAQGE